MKIKKTGQIWNSTKDLGQNRTKCMSVLDRMVQFI